MKTTPQKLSKDLKAGRFGSAYLIHGAEGRLIDRVHDSLIEALLGGEADDFNLEVFSASETSPGSVLSNLAQIPLLGGSRVVAVRHLEEVKVGWLNELLESLENPPAESHLVLASHKKVDARSKFYKKIVKAGVVVECGPPKPGELVSILKAEARELKVTISGDAIHLLQAQVGSELAPLLGELKKLALYVHPATEIRTEDVKASTSTIRGYGNFDLGDAVGELNGPRAITILHHLFAVNPPQALGPALVGVLAHRLRTMALAKGHLARGVSRREAARTMPGSPFFNEKYIDQAERLETEQLAEAIVRLHQLDLALKTGAPPRERLEGFVLWLCG